jgi:hypothetical protein
MLPEVLSSSYLHYKEDTSVFTTWLSNAAQRCGYKAKAEEQKPAGSPAVAQPAKALRLKGKERKLAKQAAAEAGKVKDDDATPVSDLPLLNSLLV